MTRRVVPKPPPRWEPGLPVRIWLYYALGYVLTIAEALPQGAICRLRPQCIDSEGRTLRLLVERRRAATGSAAYFADVFRISFEPTSAEAHHRQGVTALPIERLSKERFPGLYELLEGIRHGERDGVREGVGFSAGLQMNQALRAALNDLRTARPGEEGSVRDAAKRGNDRDALPFASAGAGPEAASRAVVTAVGILNPLGSRPLLFVKVAVDPNMTAK